MLSTEVREKLNAKIPRDAVATREGGGRSALSYLEGWYVISRMNEVFGQGKWSYEVEEMNCVHSGQDSYGKSTVHYTAKVRLIIYGEDSGAITFSDYGYGDGSDKANIGKAHELAVKEAVTDGVKRCAKNLGMSMGLALYDKKQENVDDGQVPERQQATPAQRTAPAQPARSVAGPKPAPVSTQAAAAKPVDAEIKSAVRVVLAKKLKTLDELKAHVRATYSVDGTDGLNDDQKKEVLAYLQNVANN